MRLEAQDVDNCYVYFFAHKTLPLVKIGKAVCWETRGAAVGAGDIIDENKSLIKKVVGERAAFDLEFLLHKLFEDKRKPLTDSRDGYTEWFCDSVMEDVNKLVRGLEDLSGGKIKKKSVQVGKWEGEKIDLKGDPKYLFGVLSRHASVRVEGNRIFMLPTTEDFQFVFHKVLQAIVDQIPHNGAMFPAYASLPDKEWELELPDIKDLKKYF